MKRWLEKQRRSLLLLRARLQPGPRALILAYHRVASLPTDPYRLCTPPELFRAHLDAIRRLARPLALEALVEGLETGAMPGGVVLTFDDGYADNLTTAAPMLGEYGLPATFFVTAQGCSGQEYWWDELDARYLQDDPERHRDWCLWHDVPPSPAARQLRREYRRLCRWPLARHPQGRPPARSTHRVLAAAEIQELAAQPGLTVGCHTRRHENLLLLDAGAQAAELQQSRQDLGELLGRPVVGFAYPYGHYGADTPTLVERAGFQCACTFRAGLVGPASPRYLLPRWPADAMPLDVLQRLLVEGPTG